MGKLARQEDADAEPALQAASLLNSDLRAALKRLLRPSTLQSLESWSVVAEATRQNGLQSYTGTVPTESLWAHLRNVLGYRTQTTIRDDLWEAMSSLVFERFVFQRANYNSFPTAARNDPLVGELLLKMNKDMQRSTAEKEAMVKQWWGEL